MGKASRDKGKRGEREIAALFRAHGFQARRGQQFKGGGDSPDVVHNIPGLHVEVKFRENVSLYAALDQVSRDAAVEDTPVVFMRKLRKPWIMVIDADDFLDLVEDRRKYVEDQELKEMEREMLRG